MPTAWLQPQCLVKAELSSQPAHTPQLGTKRYFHGAWRLQGCWSSLCGCRSSLHGCGSSPQGCGSSPQGCRSSPQGCWRSLHGCWSSPQGYGSSLQGYGSSPHVLTAGPFCFRKEPLQSCQSFGLRTAKHLTTPAQEKKLKSTLWQEQTWHWGPPVPRVPRRCSHGSVGRSRGAAEGPAGPGGGVAPWDPTQTPARGVRCRVLLLPLQYAGSVPATNVAF